MLEETSFNGLLSYEELPDGYKQRLPLEDCSAEALKTGGEHSFQLRMLSSILRDRRTPSLLYISDLF